MAVIPVQPVQPAPVSANEQLQTEQFQASGGRFNTLEERLRAALELSTQRQAEQETIRGEQLAAAQQRQAQLGIERPIAGLIDIFSGGQTQLVKTLPTEKEAAQQVISAGQVPVSDSFTKAIQTERLRQQEESLDLKRKLAEKKAKELSSLKESQKRLRTNDIQKSFEKEAKTKEIKETFSNVRSINSALEDGSVARVRAVLSQLVKLKGDVGNIAAREREYILPANFFVGLARAEAFARENVAEAKLPDGVLNLLKDDMANLQKSTLDFFGNRLERTRKLNLAKPTQRAQEFQDFINEVADIEKQSVEGLFDAPEATEQEKLVNIFEKLRAE